jgi:FKBP-type peptidyl-prolyl cis-trans isomerase
MSRVKGPLLLAALLVSCSASSPPASPPDAPRPLPAGDEFVEADISAEPEPPENDAELRISYSGVGIQDLREGQGPIATVGQRLTVHYVGRFEDGREFDSSRTRGTPFTFELGGGQVIAGWEEGIEGMRVGGLRRLIIPPHLAYGERGSGAIPPNAVLEFDVELLDVE